MNIIESLGSTQPSLNACPNLRVLVALFIIVAIPLGRMIEKANREDDERIELLKKHRKQ